MKASGKRGSFATQLPITPLRLTLRLDPDPFGATSAACGEIDFEGPGLPPPSCTPNRGVPRWTAAERRGLALRRGLERAAEVRARRLTSRVASRECVEHERHGALEHLVPVESIAAETPIAQCSEDGSQHEMGKGFGREGCGCAMDDAVLAAQRTDRHEFDAVHSVERARRVGSLDAVLPAGRMRPRRLVCCTARSASAKPRRARLSTAVSRLYHVGERMLCTSPWTFRCSWRARSCVVSSRRWCPSGSRSARRASLRLRVWEGRKRSGTDDAVLFEHPVAAPVTSLRIGAKLHIAQVTLKVPDNSTQTCRPTASIPTISSSTSAGTLERRRLPRCTCSKPAATAAFPAHRSASSPTSCRASRRPRELDNLKILYRLVPAAGASGPRRDGLDRRPLLKRRRVQGRAAPPAPAVPGWRSDLRRRRDARCTCCWSTQLGQLSSSAPRGPTGMRSSRSARWGALPSPVRHARSGEAARFLQDGIRRARIACRSSAFPRGEAPAPHAPCRADHQRRWRQPSDLVRRLRGDVPHGVEPRHLGTPVPGVRVKLDPRTTTTRASCRGTTS